MKSLRLNRIVVALCAVLLVQLAAATPAAEKKVSIDQVPEKVKAAILEAVGNGQLVDIGEVTNAKGKTYEIEMIVDGKEYDVVFSSEGAVLKKSFEGSQGGGIRIGKMTASKSDKFQDSFALDGRELVSTGRNRYFILEPGYRLVLAGKDGEHAAQLAITVLDETKQIGNIETRVVEERETIDGELVEVSRNFFAMCKQTQSVFYFGEEVDIYEDGKVVDHEGAWLHGENNARAGLMMPGETLLGARYYQEVAPQVAMDRGEIVDVAATLKTPAGEFQGCLKIQEENPLDQEQEFKLHAPGIGLVQDEDLLLTDHGFVSK